MRRLAITAAAVLIAVVVFVLVVHTPPVRRAVLRYVVAEVQRRYAIRIEASRLDYNLAELTIGLADVRVTALSAEARGATAGAANNTAGAIAGGAEMRESTPPSQRGEGRAGGARGAGAPAVLRSRLRAR